MKELKEILSCCQECPYHIDDEWEADRFLCKKLHYKGVEIIDPLPWRPDWFPPQCPLPDTTEVSDGKRD